jgi:hypothetical protein
MPLDGAVATAVSHHSDMIASCRQKYPLPPDVRYVLDHLLDEWGLDEGSYMALNLFVPRAPIIKLIDCQPGERISERGMDRKKTLAESLLDLIDDAFSCMTPIVQSGLAHASLHWLARDLHGLGQIFAHWAFEDEISGGCLKNFRDRKRICRNGDVWPRTLRRIHSPAFISRYVKRAQESEQRRRLATRILNRTERVPVLDDHLAQYSVELTNQREDARRAAIAQFEASGVAGAPLRSSGTRRALRKRVASHRAIIKRAVNAASMILSSDQISAFASGAPVRLPGQSLDLLVTLSGGLADCGHGAISVAAAAPQGEVLASLCTYVEGTPALDQLAALALAMKAGEEAQIISDANIIKMMPAEEEHPLLAERASRHLAQQISRASNWTRIGRDCWSYEERRGRIDAYWNATQAIWLERLAVFACGRRVKLLARCAP